MLVLNQPKELCNLHYYKRNEDKAKGDEIHMPRQCYHTERDANGCKEHEGNECDGSKSCQVECTVCTVV